MIFDWVKVSKMGEWAYLKYASFLTSLVKGCTRRHRESAICASEFRPKHLAGTRLRTSGGRKAWEQDVDNFNHLR